MGETDSVHSIAPLGSVRMKLVKIAHKQGRAEERDWVSLKELLVEIGRAVSDAQDLTL